MSKCGAQKSFKKRDLPKKGVFLKKGGLNLHAIHLQENYENGRNLFFTFTLFYTSSSNFI